MGQSVPKTDPNGHRNSLDAVRPAMAKADLNDVEVGFKSLIGRAIQRAISLAGWTQKEAAGHLGRDTAQLARWISGAERPQFDVLFACAPLRWPLIQCLSQLDEQNEVVTTITRRSA
jgi:hypothetical protein